MLKHRRYPLSLKYSPHFTLQQAKFGPQDLNTFTWSFRNLITDNKCWMCGFLIAECFAHTPHNHDVWLDPIPTPCCRSYLSVLRPRLLSLLFTEKETLIGLVLCDVPLSLFLPFSRRIINLINTKNSRQLQPERWRQIQVCETQVHSGGVVGYGRWMLHPSLAPSFFLFLFFSPSCHHTAVAAVLPW